MRGVATGFTPVPICRPVGNCVCCDELAPAWRTFWYSKSSNCTRARLNPVVLTLARLLATTSSCVCCASMPVLLIQRLLITVLTPCLRRYDRTDRVRALLKTARADCAHVT